MAKHTPRAKRPASTLSVRNFAQIKSADIEFGDLTVLVGPQGSGKSLLLQLFKLARDQVEIMSALKDAGHIIETRQHLLDIYLGQGMRHAWGRYTKLLLDGKEIDIDQIPRKKGKTVQGSVFYIPAHRAMLVADGWPAPFNKLSADTPAIARLFSQNLFELFGGLKNETELFPVPKRLKQDYRTAINDAVFHGGRVQLGYQEMRKRLELSYGDDTHLPYMAWTAGQREFTPLLMGLYHLLPSTQSRKREGIEWVIIEEPEMGMHPRAITVVMLLVLDLLWRGYRVIISTHAPLVLDVVWALRVMQDNNSGPAALAKAFGIRAYNQILPVAQAALAKNYRVFAMDFGDSKVISKDISNLDPSSEDESEAGWGGLTSFSSKFAQAVAGAANE